MSNQRTEPENETRTPTIRPRLTAKIRAGRDGRRLLPNARTLVRVALLAPLVLLVVKLPGAAPTMFVSHIAADSTNSRDAVKARPTAQATLPPLIVFTAQLTPANEVPPVTNADATAVGEAVVTLHVTQDSMGNITAAAADFAVAALDLPATDTIILAHIHHAAAGVAGAVVVDSGVTPGSPVQLLAGNTLFFRSNLAVSASTAQAMIGNPSDFYFNVHTPANPGGAIRGQLAAVSTTTSPLVFATLLLPNNEVPPITDQDAAGEGLVVVALIPTRDAMGNIISATAQFDWVAAGLPATDMLILSHIHMAAAGANGAVVVDSGLRPSSPVALSSAGSATFTTSGLAVSSSLIPALLATPENFYFNIHSNTHPGGVMRGQLGLVPVITNVTASGKSLIITGLGFTTGSAVLVGGQQANTKNDPANPTTSLVGKKALKLIPRGGSADVEVQNPNGLQSASVVVSRP